MWAFLRLMRFPLAFTAAADSSAGYLIASGGTLSIRWLFVAGASFAAYCLGMVLNDLSDLVVDRERHPDRPLVRGHVSLAGAWILVSILLCTGVGLGFAVGGAAPGMFALLILSIVAYDFVLKRLGVLGAAGMGWARAANFLFGLACAGPEFPWHPHALVLLCYVASITGASLLEERPSRGWFIAYAAAAALSSGSGAYHALLRESVAGTMVYAVGVAGVAALAGRALYMFDKRAIMGFILGSLLLLVVLDCAAVTTEHGVGAGVWILGFLPLALGARLLMGRAPKPADT